MSLSSRLLPGVPLVESPLFSSALDEMNLEDSERDIAIQLNARGYAVFDFPDDELDARIERIKATLSAHFQTDFTDPEAVRKIKGGLRVQDAWKQNEDVRAIACNSRVIALLSKLYGRRAFPFQTLNFPVGTQQHMHSDSVHFSTIPERFMCGVWLAFEDVSPDAGPLVYYPGSHKWPILTNDAMNLRRQPEAAESAQKPYEPVWRAMVEQAGLAPERFCARKGQALIWAANLLHGGDRRIDPALTRWSQVTHYYFHGCAYYTPAYSNPAIGRLWLREIEDAATGERVENIYIDAPIRHQLRHAKSTPAPGARPLWRRLLAKGGWPWP